MLLIDIDGRGDAGVGGGGAICVTQTKTRVCSFVFNNKVHTDYGTCTPHYGFCVGSISTVNTGKIHDKRTLHVEPTFECVVLTGKQASRAQANCVSRRRFDFTSIASLTITMANVITTNTPPAISYVLIDFAVSG
eukprot:m.98318 g.98318  ORF g.98318 m.98318 type:complete len:135 (+) comp27051_c1_seq1:96-500(+)